MKMACFCLQRDPSWFLWIVCVGIPVLVGTASTEMSRTARSEGERQLLYSILRDNNSTAIRFEGSRNVPKIDAKEINAATTITSRFKRSAQTSLEQIEAVKKMLSENCRGQVDFCSSYSEEAKAGRYCDAFKSSLAKFCITSGGKCSDRDFIALKSAACYVMTTPSASAVSESRPTQAGNQGLASLSPSCLLQISVCQRLPSPGSEDPCEIMRSSPVARECLTGSGPCTGAEFNILKNMACAGVDRTTSGDVVHTTRASTGDVVERMHAIKQGMSKKCQDQIDVCNSMSPEAKEGKFCAALRSVLAEGCITSPGACSKNDFNKLKTAACESSRPDVQKTPAVSESVLQRMQTFKKTLPEKCQDEIDSCNSLSPDAREGRYCDALRSALAEGCITGSGACSKDDFNKLKTTACTTTSGGHHATNVPPQATVHPVMAVIESLDKTCQKRIKTCSEMDSQGKQDFVQAKYCQTFGRIEAKLCLLVTEECSDEEYEKLRAASCGKGAAGAPTICLQLLLASILLCILRQIA